MFVFFQEIKLDDTSISSNALCDWQADLVAKKWLMMSRSLKSSYVGVFSRPMFSV